MQLFIIPNHNLNIHLVIQLSKPSRSPSCVIDRGRGPSDGERETEKGQSQFK